MESIGFFNIINFAILRFGIIFAVFRTDNFFRKDYKEF